MNSGAYKIVLVGMTADSRLVEMSMDLPEVMKIVKIRYPGGEFTELDSSGIPGSHLALPDPEIEDAFSMDQARTQERTYTAFIAATRMFRLEQPDTASEIMNCTMLFEGLKPYLAKWKVDTYYKSVRTFGHFVLTNRDYQEAVGLKVLAFRNVEKGRTEHRVSLTASMRDLWLYEAHVGELSADEFWVLKRLETRIREYPYKIRMAEIILNKPMRYEQSYKKILQIPLDEQMDTVADLVRKYQSEFIDVYGLDKNTFRSNVMVIYPPQAVKPPTGYIEKWEEQRARVIDKRRARVIDKRSR